MAVSIFSVGGSAHAGPVTVSGAIFTTLDDGTRVNMNIYSSKNDVYLDGGPGPGAPQGAAGLPDGTYVFQVTDPSGKNLLSTDAAACRQFTVSAGIITGVAPSGACAHVTGTDIDHGATTVQLMPYNDTTNPGGEYKVWATPVGQYACDLAVVDCGVVKGPDGAMHGFVPSESKTDNFKVKESIVVEIDTEFFDNAGNPIDGLMVTWTDTLGAHNNKWSEYDPQLLAYNQAHVEDVEIGTHQITIANQAATSTTPACNITEIDTQFPGQPTVQVLSGPGTVSVKIPNNAYNNKTDQSYFINVYCA